MKKILGLLIVIVFGFMLYSCKDDEDDPNPTVNYETIVNAAQTALTTGLSSNEISEGYFILSPTFSFDYESESYTIDLTWSSDSESVAIYPSTETVNAIVSRPAAGQSDENVTLSVSLSIEGQTATKTFNIVIKAYPFWEYTYQLPDTAALANEDAPFVVENAPELLILGIVLDTVHYYHYETMSGYEYIKVYNNTTQPYNMKNHRIALANPMQGQNYENEDSKVGNEVLSTAYLFYSIIDEDFIIQPLSTALIWLQPYFWVAGAGSNAFNKDFSAMVVHADSETEKGAFNQTLQDFKDFWELDESFPVYRATNMPQIGKKIDGGTSDFYPILSPGAGTPYTHLNSMLLRSIEISKFNDQGGTAEINILNKYEDLSPEKQANPDLVYGKQVFNTVEIRDNSELVDAYYHVNTWQYFDPIIRANFLGRINLETIDTSGTVNFGITSNPGTMGWENTTELQFRPPVVGERVMQLQLMVREYSVFMTYLDTEQLSIMRFSSENISAYRMVDKTIYVTVDLTIPGVTFNPRSDEIPSPGRMSGAAPSLIKVINLVRP